MNVKMVTRWSGLMTMLGMALLGGIGQFGEVVAGGGGCHGTPANEGSGDRVELTGNCFSPTVLNVEPGTSVTFENLDMAQHDVAGVAGTWGTQGKLLGEGGTATVTFSKPGLYPYSCYLHYGMTGVISVGEDRVAGSAPGDTKVSRAPGADFAFKDGSAKADAESADGGISELWLAGGGLLVGAMVVLGAWVVRARR